MLSLREAPQATDTRLQQPPAFPGTIAQQLTVVNPFLLNSATYLVLVGQSTLGPLCLPAELAQGPVILADILVVLPLDELDEVLHDSLVEVLSCTSPDTM